MGRVEAAADPRRARQRDGVASEQFRPGRAGGLKSDIWTPPNGGDIGGQGTRVDAFARYRWKAGAKDAAEVALTGKVRNLLNREFEERKGYPSPGINFLLGAEVAI
jgi:hypothetical protein